MIKPSDFIHPEDDAALRQLESIPGFIALSRRAMELGYENYRYGLNMASSIRLSPMQLPELYNKLPPICEKLGMSVPEFYLEMKLKPNAVCSGVKRTYIRMTSGLIEYMDDDEVEALLAHECGHLICNHNLYRILIEYIRDCPNVAKLFPKPMLYALMYWYRKSELSSDRCACLVTSPETVVRAMSHFSGGPKSIVNDLNIKEWINQAERYEKIKTDGLWNKVLQWYVTVERTHPFDVVRVREILKWGRTDQYKTLKSKMMSDTFNKVCQNCKKTIEPNWIFCKYCGNKL